MARNNIWISAADGNEASVLRFLSSDPSSVNSLDDFGYTPLHAAVSYNHISLLRKLVLEHGGNPNLEDHDGDTPLFVAETVPVARVLVEELGADPAHRNHEGLTAADVIEADGEFPLVAVYLRSLQGRQREASAGGGAQVLPPSLAATMSASEQQEEELPPVDEEMRGRIEALAARADHNSAEAQEEMRKLVTEIVQNHVIDQSSRNARARQE